MSFRPKVPRIAFSAAVAAKEYERRKAGLPESGIALDGGFEALEDYPGPAEVAFAAVDATHDPSIVLGQLDSKRRGGTIELLLGRALGIITRNRREQALSHRHVAKIRRTLTSWVLLGPRAR